MSIEKYTTYSPNILKYLGSDAKSQLEILDVGCSNGEFGKAVANAGLSFRISGIEINSEAADLAKKSGYVNVVTADLNQIGLDKALLQSEQYDYVVFGDVLEHTIRPCEILVESKKLLKADGKVAISLPNIGFIFYRLTHLLGHWNYKETGVMDKTHLVFFTVFSASEMIREAGFQVKSTDGYIGIENRPWVLRKVLRWLAKVWPALFALQITFLAEPIVDVATNTNNRSTRKK